MRVSRLHHIAWDVYSSKYTNWWKIVYLGNAISLIRDDLEDKETILILRRSSSLVLFAIISTRRSWISRIPLIIKYFKQGAFHRLDKTLVVTTSLCGSKDNIWKIRAWGNLLILSTPSSSLQHRLDKSFCILTGSRKQWTDGDLFYGVRRDWMRNKNSSFRVFEGYIYSRKAQNIKAKSLNKMSLLIYFI